MTSLATFILSGTRTLKFFSSTIRLIDYLIFYWIDYSSPLPTYKTDIPCLTLTVICTLSSDTLEYLLYSVSEKKYNYFNADFVYCPQNQTRFITNQAIVTVCTLIFFSLLYFMIFFFFSQWIIPLIMAVSKVLQHLLYKGGISKQFLGHVY